ncbi:MAG: hypothetical protein V1837_07365 [Candidatus Woesearchaeota archaeon]
MTDKTILDYARKAAAIGAAKSVVKARLLSAGWPEQDVSRAISSAYSKKHKLMLPLLMLLLLCLALVVLFYNTQTSASSIMLNFQVPKSVYKVGEPFSGSLSFHHSFLTFRSVLLLSYQEQDFPSNSTLTASVVEPLSFRDQSLPLAAFSLHDNALEFSDSFARRGMYSFYVSVFSCAVLEKKLHKSCSEITKEDISTLLPLLTSMVKVVVVS